MPAAQRENDGLRSKCGVYAITHIPTGQQYIGASRNIARRWFLHKSELRHDIHHSPQMQELWNRDGSGAFHVEIIERIGHWTALPAREEFYLARRFQLKGSHEFNCDVSSNCPEGSEEDCAYAALDVVRMPSMEIPLTERSAVGECTAMATLQEMRESAHLSRNQLAARTGGVVDVTTIYRIEEGKAVPRLTTQKVLADALGVGVDEIDWPATDKGGGKHAER